MAVDTGRSRSFRSLAPLLLAGLAAGGVACLSLVYPGEAVVGSALILGAALALYLFADVERTYLAMVFCLPILGIGRLEVGVTVTLSKFFAAVLVVQLLIVHLQGRHRFRVPWSSRDRFLLYFWIYALMVSLIALFSLDRVAGSAGLLLRGPYLRFANQLAVLALMAGVYFATRTVVRDARMLRRTVRTLLLSFALMSAYGVYQFVGYRLGLPFTDIRQGATAISRVGTFFGITRISSLSGEPKHFALTALPVLMLLLSLRASRNTQWGTGTKNFLLLMLLLTAFAGTFSRAGYILFPVCLAAFPLLQGRAGIGRLWKTVGLGVLVLLVIALVGARLIGVNVLEIFVFRIGETEMEAWSGTIDYPKVLGALKLAMDHPIFGVGLGNATFYIKNAMAEMGWLEMLPVENPPNQFLALLAETGIVGLTLFALFSVGTLLGIRSRVGRIADPGSRQLAQAILFGSFAMLAVYTYMTWLSEPFLWFWLGLAHASVDIPLRSAGEVRSSA